MRIKRPDPRNYVMLGIRLAPDVKHAAKVQALIKDTTLREWIIEAVTEKLARDAKGAS